MDGSLFFFHAKNTKRVLNHSLPVVPESRPISGFMGNFDDPWNTGKIGM